MPTPIPVRLPDDLVAWIDHQAKTQAEARSTVIRQLLRAEMERQQRSQKRLANKAQAHSGEG